MHKKINNVKCEISEKKCGFRVHDCFLKDHDLIVVRIKEREQALGVQF
jgi:hypothetical protein